ncbi:hypothetical protein [Geomonas sp.]|nr:hypothetical protein [Geomonas sp.]HJV36366.1 hypothetical protein [Geomonas sp.]
MDFHVFHLAHAQVEEWIPHEFWGNKPALPPLTTETVESVVYEMDEEQQQ